MSAELPELRARNCGTVLRPNVTDLVQLTLNQRVRGPESLVAHH